MLHAKFFVSYHSNYFKLRIAFSEEYQVLVELVELLPSKVDSPVAPFLSFILNINLVTIT